MTATRGRDSDWDEVPGMKASTRSTTSSRHPGVKFVGTVYTEARSLVLCPTCGGLRRYSTAPHAPRWVDGRQLDCAGRSL
jgi:hypothetical protein